MATTVQSTVQLPDAQQLATQLRPAFPNYKIAARGRKVVVIGTGSATGVGIAIRGPHQAKLNWQFPSLGVQMLLTVGIVFTGILPGLIAFLIVWLVVKDDVKRIEQEVTTVLQNAAPP